MSITPTDQASLDGLIDAVALLLTQVRMGEGLGLLQRTVKDIRCRLGKLLHDSVSANSVEHLAAIEKVLADRLAECRKLSVHSPSEELNEHIDYCLREIMVCFELARQICAEHNEVETRQQLLDDIPILRPFDYGLECVAK